MANPSMNPSLLPEIRQMIAEKDDQGLTEIMTELHITPGQWFRVLRHELLMGSALGLTSRRRRHIWRTRRCGGGRWSEGGK